MDPIVAILGTVAVIAVVGCVLCFLRMQGVQKENEQLRANLENVADDLELSQEELKRAKISSKETLAACEVEIEAFNEAAQNMRPDVAGSLLIDQLRRVLSPEAPASDHGPDSDTLPG